MRNIFGRKQLEKADLVVENYYDLLAKEGKSLYHEKWDETKTLAGKKINNEYVVAYMYNDTSDDSNGKLLIEEHYDKQ